MRERVPLERIADFAEVNLGYSDEEAYAEAERCLQCRNPLCIEGCPVGVDIKSFIGRILEHDVRGGIEVIKNRGPLPAACGRVCPQEDQCEAACVLARTGEPVAIGRLERYVADKDLAESIDRRCCPKAGEPTGRRVAVVGSGPAGLSCAGELAAHGHEVTIFESLHVAGGVLVYGIPEFRLPMEIVASEIAMLQRMGVKILTDAVIGSLYTVPELLTEEGFDAVFIGVGAGLPIFLGVPGENLNGVYSANEFLTRVNLMRAHEFPKSDTPVWRGRKVAVLGGGNVAMDAARTALRLGAEEAFLIYRRSADEMPARREELEHARAEGVEFRMLCQPSEIVGRDGFVTGIIVTRNELGEPDSSGRRAPVCVVGSEFEIECDTVIVAVGTRSNAMLAKAAPDIERDRRGYVVTGEDGATSLPGVFAGGDIVTGSATVILAMGAGKRAARAIDRWLAERD